MKLEFLCWIFLLALPLCTPLPTSAAWHLPEAEFRKELKVEGEGGEVVTAVTSVFLDDRISGFVLTDARGAPRPCGLLNRHGSMYSIHFNATPGESLYLYAGAMPPPPPELEHVSGLRRQTRGYDGREVFSAAAFTELWNAAPYQGGAFVSQVYCAFNPFGPNANALHLYEGFLQIDTEGLTQFCLASTDASFLLINGHEVVAWPGRHPVKDGLGGAVRGALHLQPGRHRFKFLHANSSSESYAIAAMVVPGGDRHLVIAPQYFTGAAYAFVGPLRDRSGQAQAEFIWNNSYMVNIPAHDWDPGYRLRIAEQCLHQVKFEAVPLPEFPDAQFSWDFGDGCGGSGPNPEHLYFARGDYSVTLTVTLSNGQKLTGRQTVQIVPRYGQNENDDARALALLDQAVRQESTRGIAPAGYTCISHGYFFLLQERKAAGFAPRILAAQPAIADAAINTLMLQLAVALQEVDEQYELAEQCFRVILDQVNDSPARAFAALHYGGMLNLCLNRPAEARAVLSAIDRQALDAVQQRLLELYLADTVLVLDDHAAARKLYAAIARPEPLLRDGKLNRQAMFEYNSRYFRLRNLLSQELYRESLIELNQLEWDMPEERMAPRINLLKAQALIGNKQPRKAVVCLQRALLAEVDDVYRPQLRLELAKVYTELNQLAQARWQIALIRKESPWTPEEIAARKLLLSIESKTPLPVHAR